MFHRVEGVKNKHFCYEMACAWNAKSSNKIVTYWRLKDINGHVGKSIKGVPWRNIWKTMRKNVVKIL